MRIHCQEPIRIHVCMFALQKSGKSRIFADWLNCSQGCYNHARHVIVEHITFSVGSNDFHFHVTVTLLLNALFMFVIMLNLSNNLNRTFRRENIRFKNSKVPLQCHTVKHCVVQRMHHHSGTS